MAMTMVTICNGSRQMRAVDLPPRNAPSSRTRSTRSRAVQPSGWLIGWLARGTRPRAPVFLRCTLDGSGGG